jgi:hypothetical protein
MKITYRKAIVAYNRLKKFNPSIPGDKFKTAHRLGIMENKLESFIAPCAKEEKKIWNKYGVPEEVENENGEKVKTGLLVIPSEKSEEFNSEINTLQDQEDDFTYTINLSLFEGIETTKEFFKDLGDFVIDDLNIEEPK